MPAHTRGAVTDADMEVTGQSPGRAPSSSWVQTVRSLVPGGRRPARPVPRHPTRYRGPPRRGRPRTRRRSWTLRSTCSTRTSSVEPLNWPSSRFRSGRPRSTPDRPCSLNSPAPGSRTTATVRQPLLIYADGRATILFPNANSTGACAALLLPHRRARTRPGLSSNSGRESHALSARAARYCAWFLFWRRTHGDFGPDQHEIACA